MSATRVLLVEDDPSIQRFVELALEELAVDLHIASSPGEALQALRAGRFAVLLTDLTLQGGSGLQVLQALHEDPTLGGGPRRLVFSASLSPSTRRQLAAWGVDEIIAKPAPLQVLLDAVRRGLDGPPPAPGAAPHGAPDGAAVDRYFGGNRALYDSFRASCLTQFGADLQLGAAALAAGDAAALQRLAHSLKTVLLSLGHEAASELARRAERSAASGVLADAGADWAALAAALGRIVGEGADPGGRDGAGAPPS